MISANKAMASKEALSAPTHKSEPTPRPISAPVEQPNGAPSLDMKRESDRLKTFDNWPLAFLHPAKLARTGFYYLNVSDRVRCEFCKLEVASWEEEDDPAVDHRRWAPNCPFLRKRNVGNIPLGQSEAPPRPSTSFDVCGPHNRVRPSAICESPTEQLRLGIPITKSPEHTSYVSYAARLKSFATWPVSIKQRPEELAEAGFFYTGKGDSTICFHCGGGTKGWEPQDNAWEQHARWFSKCSYVQLMKGKDYVKSVLSSAVAMLTPTAAKELEVKPSVNVVIPAKKPEDIHAAPKAEAEELVAEDKLCKICYIEEKNTVFVPCGHVVACVKCSLSVTECPVCRTPYTGVVKLFFS